MLKWFSSSKPAPTPPDSPPFDVGDIVYLKGGSPAMTIDAVMFEEKGWHVKAFWFDESNTLCASKHHHKSLTREKIEEPRRPIGFY